MRALQKSLRPEYIPPLVSLLCYQSKDFVDRNSSLIGLEDGMDSMKWTVGALIFLRHLVPSVTTVISNSNYSDIEKKAAVLIGRLLMKLSCDSQFSENSSCLLNEIICESSKVFQDFCSGVISLGKELLHASSMDLFLGKIERENLLADLHLFLCDSKSTLTRTCQQIYEKDAEFSGKFLHYFTHQFDGEQLLTHEKFESSLSEFAQMIYSFDPSSLVLSPSLTPPTSTTPIPPFKNSEIESSSASDHTSEGDGKHILRLPHISLHHKQENESSEDDPEFRLLKKLRKPSIQKKSTLKHAKANTTPQGIASQFGFAEEPIRPIDTSLSGIGAEVIFDDTYFFGDVTKGSVNELKIG